MTAGTPPRGAAEPSSRHGKMRARWNRAFIVLIGLSVVTAALRFAFIQQVESSFSAATDELSRETAGYDRLVSALTNEAAAAYLARIHRSASVSEV